MELKRVSCQPMNVKGRELTTSAQLSRHIIVLLTFKVGLLNENMQESIPKLLEESLLLTKVYLVVRQNVSWLIQSSVTTKIRILNLNPPSSCH